ncbi:MAG: hypothetical protein Q7T01_04555 [bacterium]|nr:hypothetical protein [bacterium]
MLGCCSSGGCTGVLLFRKQTKASCSMGLGEVRMVMQQERGLGIVSRRREWRIGERCFAAVMLWPVYVIIWGIVGLFIPGVR